MGAWGAGSFENDDAMDWVAGLAAGSPDGVLREALTPIASGGAQHLEGPDCSIAIAAAEAIAAARGRPSDSLPAEVTEWAATKPKVADALATMALMALDRIANKSELKDLWDESESAAEWRAAMASLRERLQ